MSRIRSFAALLAVVLLPPAFGQQASGSLRIIREHYDITVGADGGSVTLIEVALSPLTPASVQNAGRISIPYQEGRSEVEILEAYSQKPDGTRSVVQPDRILTQVPPAAAQAPAFADGKVKVLLFPDVAVGDQVVYKARLTQREPKFPGQYSGFWFYPRSTVYDDVRLVIRAPSKLTLKVDSRELIEQPVARADGFTVREWRFRNDPAVLPEPGAVDVLDRDPRIVVSTFADWAALAKAYDARAAQMTAVTDEIRRMAAQIVGTRTAPRDKAKAIFEWVSANVRYVAVYLGAGGYVPHPAEEVLRNRYGDCKDYTALLGALLAAEGIDSTPVLINAGARFSLPSVVSPEWFNHVILWVPPIDEYLDATARVLPFGVLAEAVTDKPVLPTRAYKTMLRTPMTTATANVMHSEAHLVVGADGRATGEASLTAKGQPGAGLRNLLQNAPPTFESQFVGGLLGRAGLTGTGTLVREVSGDLDKDPRLTVKFETGSWINLPGPGAFRLPTGLFALVGIRAVSLGLLSTPPQKVHRTCIPMRFEEKLSIELPANLTPRVPADGSFSNRVATFESHYTLQGRTLTATRTLALAFAHVSCPPEDGAALREAAEALRRDVEGQVLY